MPQTIYAVVGNGTAPASVIEEGLRDSLKEGDAVALVWTTPEDDDGIGAVYDYILDNDIQFCLYYAEGDKVPRVFRESEVGVVQKVKNPALKALGDISGKGKVLFLWDTAAEDDQIDVVFDTIDEGVLVLELTNGLDPIKEVAAGEIPEPSDPDLEEVDPADAPDKEDDTRFTKAELEVMAAAAVKRYGKRIGTTATTMKGIIAELFPEGDDDEKETEAPAKRTARAQEASEEGGDIEDVSFLKIDAFLTHTFGAKYTQFSS